MRYDFSEFVAFYTDNFQCESTALPHDEIPQLTNVWHTIALCANYNIAKEKPIVNIL